VREFEFAFKNEHSHDVKVGSLQFQFSSGKKNSALFYDGIQFQRKDGQKEKGCFSFASNMDGVADVDCYAASHATDLGGADFFNVRIYIEKKLQPGKTNSKPDMGFTMRPQEVFTITLYGTSYGKKENDKDVWPVMSHTQEFEEETSIGQVTMKRACVA
jgi:hypothetical protein